MARRFLPAEFRTARMLADFTQEQAAVYAGCTRSTVASGELGYSVPAAETLVALADLYEVPIDAFFGEEDAPMVGKVDTIERGKVTTLATGHPHGFDDDLGPAA